MTRHTLFLSLFLAVATLLTPAASLPPYAVGVQGTLLAPSSGLDRLIHNATTHATPILTIQHPKRQEELKEGENLFRYAEDALSCEPPPPPTEKYLDAHYGRVKDATKFFCRHVTFSRKPMWSTLPIAQTIQIITHDQNFLGIPFHQHEKPIVWRKPDELNYKKDQPLPADVYELRIERVEGCREPPMTGEYPSAAEPRIHLKCKRILKHAWKRCYDNKGRGGSLQAGCYRYFIHTKF